MKNITVDFKTHEIEYVRGSKEELLEYLIKESFNKEGVQESLNEYSIFMIQDTDEPDYPCHKIIIQNDAPENELRRILRESGQEMILSAALLD